MSNNKVLFQVELLPPNQGQIQRVKDVINEVEQAQKKASKATQQNQYDEQAQTVKNYRLQLLQLRNEIEEGEQATRFDNKNKQKTLELLNDKKAAARTLREDIKDLNISTTQEAKLRQKANAVYKRANLAHGRIQTDFKQMARVGGASNQTLLETGRIVSDLPFGFLGISNNVEAATAAFANLIRKNDGVKGALQELKKSLTGPAGLTVAFSSVVPAAVTFATIGLRNWGVAAGKSEKETKNLSDGLQTLEKGFENLAGIEGSDPFGIQSVVNQVRALRSGLPIVQEVLDAQERVQEIRENTDAGIAVRFDIQDAQDELSELEKTLGVSADEAQKFVDKMEQGKDALEDFVEQSKLSPLQEFAATGFLKVNQAVERYELGLRTAADGQTTMETRLKNLRKEISASVEEYRNLVDQGNQEYLPYLKAATQLLENLDEAMPDVPDKPVIDIAPPEDEVIDILGGLERQIMDFQDDIDEGFEHSFFVPDPKDIRKMNDKAFKVRQEMLQDSIAIHSNHFHQLRSVEADAAEMGLENHESVERLKAAITERYAYERQQIELERERNLMDAKMNMASEFSNFMGAVNSALREESLALSLAILAVNKGLAIAEVITEANARVFELNAAANTAVAKAGIKAANPVTTPQAAALFTAAANARAQAAKVKANAMTTAGIIAATGLAEGVGQVVGSGGSGGGSGSSGSSGSSNQTGFVTDDIEDENRNRLPSGLGSRADRQIVYVNVDNRVDEKGIATMVQRGNRQRDKTLQGIKSVQRSN